LYCSDILFNVFFKTLFIVEGSKQIGPKKKADVERRKEKGIKQFKVDINLKLVFLV